MEGFLLKTLKGAQASALSGCILLGTFTQNYRCEQWEDHRHLVVPVLDHSAVQRQVPGSGAVPNLPRYDHQERTATFWGGGAEVLGHKKRPNSGVQKLNLNNP